MPFAQGQRFVKEANPIKSPEENLAELAKQARELNAGEAPALPEGRSFRSSGCRS